MANPGRFAMALRTEDGAVHFDPAAKHHAEVMVNLGVNPDLVESTGYVDTQTGEYLAGNPEFGPTGEITEIKPYIKATALFEAMGIKPGKAGEGITDYEQGLVEQAREAAKPTPEPRPPQWPEWVEMPDVQLPALAEHATREELEVPESHILPYETEEEISLQNEFLKYLPKGSKWLGEGIEASAYKSPSGEVYRVEMREGQFYSLIERGDIEAVLQSTGVRVVFSGDKYAIIEKLPFVEMFETKYLGLPSMEQHVKFSAIEKELEQELEKHGFYHKDLHSGNVGFYQGRWVIVDPGGLNALVQFDPTQGKDVPVPELLKRQREKQRGEMPQPMEFSVGPAKGMMPTSLGGESVSASLFPAERSQKELKKAVEANANARKELGKALQRFGSSRKT